MRHFLNWWNAIDWNISWQNQIQNNFRVHTHWIGFSKENLVPSKYSDLTPEMYSMLMIRVLSALCKEQFLNLHPSRICRFVPILFQLNCNYPVSSLCWAIDCCPAWNRVRHFLCFWCRIGWRVHLLVSTYGHLTNHMSAVYHRIHPVCCWLCQLPSITFCIYRCCTSVKTYFWFVRLLCHWRKLPLKSVEANEPLSDKRGHWAGQSCVPKLYTAALIYAEWFLQK